ncbi:MAG: amidohydrolase family protein, partial [Dehalococcoidia bacterium]|nr:amidohydrolase family protein [Dehalococcoidia bacterium]
GLIADGVHVHPAVLDLVFRVKGAGGVALVSDALQSVGTDATSFRLQGRPVEVRDGVCYLEDGTLAGSALSMNRAVHLMERSTAAGLIDCVRMATATPARVLGLQDEIGVLRPGARADIVVCYAGLSVWKVFVAGALAYDAEKHQATR